MTIINIWFDRDIASLAYAHTVYINMKKGDGEILPLCVSVMENKSADPEF